MQDYIKMNFPPEIIDFILSSLHPYYANQYCLTCRDAYSYSDKTKYQLELLLIHNPIPESIKYYDPLYCLYYALKSGNNIDIFLNELTNVSVKVAIIMSALLFEFKKHDHLLSLSQTHEHAFVFRSILHAYCISFHDVIPEWGSYPNIYECIVHELGGRNLCNLFMFMSSLNRLLLLASLTIGNTLPFGIASLPYRRTSKCLGYLTDEDLPIAKLFLSKHFPTFVINPVRNIEDKLLAGGHFATLPSVPFSLELWNDEAIKSIRSLSVEKQGMYFAFAGLYDEYVKWKKQGNKLMFVYLHYIPEQCHSYEQFKDIQIQKVVGILGVTSHNRDCLNTPVCEERIPKDWYY